MAQIIRKLKLRVRIFRPGETPGEGFLHVNSGGSGRAPQTLLQRLNSRIRFLPFDPLESPSTLLLNRKSLERVIAGPEIEPDLVCDSGPGVSRDELVRVRFAGGGQVEGLLEMTLPHETSRTSDFMNRREDFFPLFVSGEIWLINKRSVTDLLVYDESPLPPGTPGRLTGRP